MSRVVDYPRRSKPGEPVWEMASLYPVQGNWDEHDYLGITQNVLVEFDHGTVEFLPMPTLMHQLVVGAIYSLLKTWGEAHGGVAVQAPLPLKVREAKYREPDVMFLLDSKQHSKTQSFLSAADFVVEVVSEGKANRARDYEDKRIDYAAAGVREYWIIDPQEKRVLVLSLKRGKYVEYASADATGSVKSALLSGFEVPVAPLFAWK